MKETQGDKVASTISSLDGNGKSMADKISSRLEDIPSFKKILIPDDGKDASSRVVNYGISLANSFGAELLFLQILDQIDKIKEVSVETSASTAEMNSRNIKREVKGEIVSEMEQKVKRCRDSGCKSKISYKFRTGDPLNEIVSEVKEGHYDLIILKNTDMDSWLKSAFSDTRKIIRDTDVPILIIQ